MTLKNIVPLSLLLCALTVVAQETTSTAAKTPQAKAAETSAPTAPEPNPVTSTVRRVFDRQSKNVVAAADAMPAEKYGFKPTEGQISFAHIVAHIADSNVRLCSRLSAASQAPQDKPSEADGKDKLISALKKSFDFCGSQLAKVEDGQLGETVANVQGRNIPKAAVIINLPADWADHYSQMAMYLRQNGILPPSAQQAR